MGKFRGLFFLSFVMILLFSQVSVADAAEPIDEVRELIKQYYVEDVPESVLSKATIKEITDQLDPYSVYMSKQEFTDFSNSINQQLVGIGVVIEEHEQGVKVLQVIPDGPADQAGLAAGDVITEVDGNSLRGESIQTATSYLKGEEETTLTIIFLQDTTGKSVQKMLVRKAISLPVVEVDMLGGQIGYIRLNSFSLDAGEKVAGAIRSLDGAKGYILDLRDNGGGYVSAAQDVLGLFPNAVDAFQVRERSGLPELYKSIQQATQFAAPVHILINENSASASEMVAASAKEQQVATLYGQTSYGKGSMQGLFLLNSGDVLKLTTAKFYTGQGTEINEVGVKPNVSTESWMELAVSHRDHILKEYPAYNKLPALKNVPTTKTFTVKMNGATKWEQATSNDIQLIHLGGEEVPVELKPVDSKTIQVKPTELLHPGQTYLLLIHPKWKGDGDLVMKKGSYLEVGVEAVPVTPRSM